MINMESGRIAVLSSPKQESRFECGQSVCGADLCRHFGAAKRMM
jgi:hypothetical protein